MLKQTIIAEGELIENCERSDTITALKKPHRARFGACVKIQESDAEHNSLPPQIIQIRMPQAILSSDGGTSRHSVLLPLITTIKNWEIIRLFYISSTFSKEHS